MIKFNTLYTYEICKDALNHGLVLKKLRKWLNLMEMLD